MMKATFVFLTICLVVAMFVGAFAQHNGPWSAYCSDLNDVTARLERLSDQDAATAKIVHQGTDVCLVARGLVK